MLVGLPKQRLSLEKYMTAISHKFQGVLNQRELDYLFDSLFARANDKSEFPITDHLWRESTCDRGFLGTKGSLIRKASPCHDVFVGSVATCDNITSII